MLSPGKKSLTPGQLVKRDEDYGYPHFYQSIYLVPQKLPNLFVDFKVLLSSTKLKITQHIGQKVQVV